MRIATNIVTPVLRSRVTLPAVVAATVATGVAAAAWRTHHAPSSGEQAAAGATQLRESAPPGASSSGRERRATAPLQLERAAPRAANAADPASFERMFASEGPGWAAADGTISVPLPDGRSLWLFGDTVLRPPAGGTATMIRNTAVIQDGSSLTTLASGTADAPAAFLRPPDASEEWYWPAGGVAQGDEIALFMGRVRETGAGAPGWNFTGAGSDLVLIDANTMAVTSTTRMPGGDDMTWGAATLQYGGHTYVYGFEQGTESTDRRAHVARVRTGTLGDEAFEYWNGSGWTSDAERSAPVASGLSNQFSVVALPNGRFAMLSQELHLQRGLLARTASSPVGPWGEPRLVDPGPELADGVISYNATAHPQFTSEGQLLVAWNRNRPDVLAAGDPATEPEYRAAFRAVPFDAIDD